MEESKKETQRIRAYRAVLHGITNGEFIYKLRLGSTYRTRVSEIRLDMKEKFGPGPDDDWLPGKQVGNKEDNIFRWKLIIPPGADPRDPLGILNLPPEKKRLDETMEVGLNQTEMFPKEGENHGQNGNEDEEGPYQEGAGDGVSAA